MNCLASWANDAKLLSYTWKDNFTWALPWEMESNLLWSTNPQSIILCWLLWSPFSSSWLSARAKANCEESLQLLLSEFTSWWLYLTDKPPRNDMNTIRWWRNSSLSCIAKTEHECTHGWPGSVPMGILNSKCHTWICGGFSHRVTQSCESKTHRFSGTCGSTGTWKYLQVLDIK